MALQLTDSERTRLVSNGFKDQPATLTNPPGRAFDGIWVGRDETARPQIRGWLNVLAFEDEATVAMVLNHGAWEPSIRRIPDEEILWFLRGIGRPALTASIASRDPIFALPGEGAAYRLRRILGVPPLALIQPSDMIDGQPNFALRLLIRNPKSSLMTFGFSTTRTRATFLVDSEGNGTLLEASAAFSLLRWYLQLGGPGARHFDWANLDALTANGDPAFEGFFATYQALRLPGLRLALEYRASPLRTSGFTRTFAQTHQLPLALVESRLEKLLQHQERLAIF